MAWDPYPPIDADPCSTCKADPDTFKTCDKCGYDSVCPNCKTCDTPNCSKGKV